MLSALELNGFKTFADRTRLEFPHGITVVVGPNGSGKSNVVDAIKWVLGSQSIKSLRGKEMTDVIFSGTRDRRPAGAAEASLIFDNSQRIFPNEAAEIQITRRVYRSGEGEYLINKQPCRLRDVRDLLAGIGAGSGAYNIIEQGKVDAFLQSSPKDRRLVFEEAAGISRFRAKREEAARRLERVEQNLLRLADIVTELQSRLKSVRSQAVKAQRYVELAANLKLLRTRLAYSYWIEISGRIDAMAGVLQTQESEVAQCEARVNEAAAKVAQLDAKAAELRQAHVDAVAHQSTVRERIAQCESSRAGQLGRADELKQEVERLSKQLEALQSRAGSSEQLVDETRGDLQRSLQQLDSLKQQLSEQQQQHSVAESALAEVETRLSAAQTSLNDAQAQIAETEAQQQLLQTRRRAAEESAANLSSEVQPLLERRNRLAGETTRAQSKLSQAADDLATVSAALKSTQADLAENRSRLAALHKRQAELNGRLTGARERVIVLEELEHRLEGLTAGAKEVLRLSREHPDGPFRTVHGIVADLLSVDADSASLVEIALGERAGYLVVTETKALAAALAEETGAWPGRTTFLRLDVPAPASAVDRIDLAGEPGVIGRADQFVETTPELSALLRRLLGRHWFVDTLSTALRLAADIGRGLNFITAAGEAVLADGTLSVGPRQNLSGLLSRRSELRVLRDRVVEIEREAAAGAADVQHLETTINASETAARELAARHERASQVHTDAHLSATSLADRLEQLDAQLATLSARRQQACEAAQSLEHEAKQTGEMRSDLAAQAAKSREVISEAADARRELENRLAILRQAVADVRVQLARAEQRAEGLQRQVEQLERDHAERDRALSDTRRRASDCEIQRKQLEQSTVQLAEEIAQLHVRRQELSARIDEIEKSGQDVESQRATTSGAADLARKKLLEAQLAAHDARLQVQQLQDQRKVHADQMRDDYQVDLAGLAPEEVGESPASPEARLEIENEIRRLREQINADGPVNSASLEELAELEQRSGGLAAQYEDLEAAKSRLKQIVEQINDESRQLFRATLDDVRGHFQQIFAGLFGGGQADIILEEDPSGDILESGVAIIARPPGKQPRSISLLSGGERTLTCVALLLAMFRSRPSPFCVLDEVDAALDESNIDRFVGVLKEFMHSTQFIVVTHSKRTMTCAEILHGITMQHSGISKRVSVRFEDVGEDGHIRTSALRAA